jgi:hypothetical protein
MKRIEQTISKPQCATPYGLCIHTKEIKHLTVWGHVVDGCGHFIRHAEGRAKLRKMEIKRLWYICFKLIIKISISIPCLLETHAPNPFSNPEGNNRWNTDNCLKFAGIQYFTERCSVWDIPPRSQNVNRRFGGSSISILRVENQLSKKPEC